MFTVSKNSQKNRENLKVRVQWKECSSMVCFVFQAESTRKKQIQKLLSILPRRGPRAFDKFVRAIQDSYDWLAKPLRDTLHELNLKNGRFCITMIMVWLY